MSPNRDRPARGDPSREGLTRPPVLFVFAWFTLVVLLPPSNISAQWPPWLAKDEPEPVYPEILIGPDRIYEMSREGVMPFLVVDGWTALATGGRAFRGTWSLPADSIDLGGDVAGELARRSIPEPGTFVISGAMDPAKAAVLYWAFRIGGRREPMIFERDRPAEGGFDPGRLIPGRGEPDTSLVADAAWVRDRFGTEGVEILDVRDSTAWRAGHIPHALPFDPRVAVGPDGTFLEGEEIRAILAGLGPRPATTVDLSSEFVVYDGGDGREAALAALALRLGGVEKTRIFPDGWAAWRADSTAPVVTIVGAGEVEKILGEGRALVFDVRIRRDHEIRSIPGSFCIPSHVFRDSLSSVAERLRPGADPADLTLVLYCYGADCIRSRQCATWAARAGFRDLRWFLGGLPEWRVSGRETVTNR